MITVLGISGSLRWPSHTHTLLEIALGAARENGARVELLDLRSTVLPLYEPGRTTRPPLISEVRERLADAHAYLIGTPDYHGGMSGALKNLFDFLTDEMSGKVAGLIVAAGTEAGTSAVTHLRETLGYFHAWSLPYGVAATASDFDESGHPASPRLRETLLRLGRDVAVYGDLLHEQFLRDRVLGGGVHLGFAPWHARA